MFGGFQLASDLAAIGAANRIFNMGVPSIGVPLIWGYPYVRIYRVVKGEGGKEEKGGLGE